MSISIDYEERVGFEFLSGKAAALVEWRHRREISAFDALCRRLSRRNRDRRARAARPAAERARKRAYRLANKESLRLYFRAYRARQKRALFMACAQCSVRFEASRRGMRFCSRKCQLRRLGIELAAAKNMGLRNTNLEPTLRAILLASPGLTLNETWIHAPSDVTYKSIANKLSQLVRRGRVVRVDGRYSLPGDT